jgi:FkbM family methyltransferase
MSVVDVGANIGYYTVLFARQVAPGRVLAFEPSRSTRRVRRDRFSGERSARSAPTGRSC